MDVYSPITLDMTKQNTEIIHAKQYDKLSRNITAQLVAAGQPWTPPSCSKMVRYKKPDGTAGMYDVVEDGSAAVTISGSTANIILAQQALAVSGDVVVDLDLFTGTERLTSFSFIVRVEKAAIDLSPTMSGTPTITSITGGYAYATE